MSFFLINNFNSLSCVCKNDVRTLYCAYILLNSKPPGMPAGIKSIKEKQQFVEQAIKKKEYSKYIQILSRINGVEQLKIELRTVLEGPVGLQTAI